MKNTVEDVDDQDTKGAVFVSPEKMPCHVQKRARHMRENESTGIMSGNEEKITFAQLMKGSVRKDEKKIGTLQRIQVFGEALKGGLFMVFIEQEPGNDGFHYTLELAVNKQDEFAKKRSILGTAFLVSEPNSDKRVFNKAVTAGKNKGSKFARKVYVVNEISEDVEARAKILEDIVDVSLFHRILLMKTSYTDIFLQFLNHHEFERDTRDFKRSSFSRNKYILAEHCYRNNGKKLGDCIELAQAIEVLKSIYPKDVMEQNDFFERYQDIAELYFNPPYPEILVREFGYRNNP